MWECPGWWESPPPPPSPPTPPPPPYPQAPLMECAYPYGACWGFDSPPPTPPPSPAPPNTMFGRRLGEVGNGAASNSWNEEQGMAQVGETLEERRGRDLAGIAFNTNIAGLRRCCRPDDMGNPFGCYKRAGLYFSMCRPTPNVSLQALIAGAARAQHNAAEPRIHYASARVQIRCFSHLLCSHLLL